MGLYASVTDVINRFDHNELAKMTGGSSIDTAMVNSIITAVESLVDAACAKAGYTTPLSTVPPVITDLVCYLTLKRIYARKISVTEIPEGLKAMFQWAEDFLQELSDGKVNLGIPGAGSMSSSAVKHGSRPDIFVFTEKEYGQ